MKKPISILIFTSGILVSSMASANTTLSPIPSNVHATGRLETLGTGAMAIPNSYKRGGALINPTNGFTNKINAGGEYSYCNYKFDSNYKSYSPQSGKKEIISSTNFDCS